MEWRVFFMNKYGLLGKILILVLIPVLVIIALMTGVSYYFASQSLKDQSKETMIQRSGGYANSVDGKIEHVGPFPSLMVDGITAKL